MKKKSKCLIKLNLVGLLLMFFCSGLWADPGVPGKDKSTGLGLEAGYVLPSEEDFGKAPAFGLSFVYSISKQFRVEIKGSFFSSKVESDPEGLGAGNLNVIPLQLSLQYRLRLNRRFIPYVGGGIGYYLNNYSLDKNDQWQDLGFNINEEVDSVVGYHLGAGIDVFVKPNMAINIDIRYSIASYTGSYTITEAVSGISHSDTIEGDLNHLLFGVGIKFLF